MKYLIIIALWLSVSACATIVRGTNDTANFESSPTGATVVTNAVDTDKLESSTCITPCELELKRKRTWRVDFALEGYKPAAALLEPKVTGGGVASGAGNALFGGIIGLGVDAGTGANLDLRPNPMVAELYPIGSPEESRILDATAVVDEVLEESSDALDGSIVEDGELQKAPPNDQPAESDADSTATEPDSFEENADEIVEETVAPISKILEQNDNGAEHKPEPVSFEARLGQFKPGERAPNDEDAVHLNQQQLERLIIERNKTTSKD